MLLSCCQLKKLNYNTEEYIMKVKVVNRENPALCSTYDNVVKVVDVFDDNGNFCHQIRMPDGSTATYPACEWAFFSLVWEPMF